MPPKKGRDQPSDDTVTLTDAYEMEMPEEISRIYKIAKELNSKSPLEAFSEVAGVRLVGPFEVLNGNLESDADLFMQWRYKYDPPEVMTVLTDSSTNRPKTHYCYLRDSEKTLPQYVVKGDQNEYTFTIEGSSLLSLLARLSKEGSVQQTFCETAMKELSLPSEKKADLKKLSKRREKEQLASGFSKLGIVVPYDKKTEVGYRELGFEDGELKSLFKKELSGKIGKKAREELDDLFRFVDIANDECDFGHGLEVGLDLFCFAQPGSSLIKEATRILDIAYLLLNRKLFRKTIKKHFEFFGNPKSPPVYVHRT
eukprot:TRINITY_DN17529_c0_g1_i1.p1 TRINITY_DN17529_c0_g1~~TRINITY_DN17529_c0_g1_i1.p1  ORF type:complete len:312 (+),score=86.92 TRINITY_DN17529_c0_g1_i1:51-986(+)